MTKTFWDDQMDREELAEWPNCETPDCMLKQCTWAGVPLCYPCAENKLGRQHLIERWIHTHTQPWLSPPYAEGQGHQWWANYFSRLAERYERMKQRRNQ